MQPTGCYIFLNIFFKNFSQITISANIFFLSVKDYPRKSLHLSGHQEKERVILCLKFYLLFTSIGILTGQQPQNRNPTSSLDLVVELQMSVASTRAGI